MPRNRSQLRFIFWTLLTFIAFPTLCMVVIAWYFSIVEGEAYARTFHAPTESMWIGGIGVVLVLSCFAAAIVWWKYRRDLVITMAGQREEEDKLRMAEELRDHVFWLRESQRAGRIGSYDMDIPGNRWSSSEILEEIFGIDATVEKTAEFWDSLVHPEEREEMLHYFLQHVVAERNTFNKEYRIHRWNDNAERWVHGYGTLIMDEQGNPFRMIGTIQDITERKLAEQGLRAAMERAERSDKLKDHFIATMSHEIRTPLNVILGFADALETGLDAALTPQQRKMFSRIHGGSARLARTVDLILNISRAHSGDFTIVPGDIDLADLAQEQLDAIRPAAERNGIELRLVISASDTHVRADTYCMNQALANLLDNAVKFTVHGSVSLTLYADTTGDLCMDITDTGIGISDSYLPMLFTPYTQEEIGYSRSYEGIGLGLALVKKYLDLHGIPVTVHSVKGRGSTFTLNFRTVAVGGEHRPLPAALPAEVSGNDVQTGAPNGKPVLLVVEDDQDTIEYMGTILSSAYALHFATNSDDAIAILTRHAIAVVLMDISIQGPINGLGITQIIRGMPDIASTPVIAVTAHAFPADRDICLRGGCDEYLAKPIRPLELFRLLDRFVKKDA